MAIHSREALFSAVTGATNDMCMAGIRVEAGSSLDIRGIVTGPLQITGRSHVVLSGISNNSLISVASGSSLVISGILNSPAFDLAGTLTFSGILNAVQAHAVPLPHGALAAVGSLFNLATGTWLLEDAGLRRVTSSVTVNNPRPNFYRWDARRSAFTGPVVGSP